MKTVSKAGARYIIALAKVEMTGLRETGRWVRSDCYNYKPELEWVPQAKALIWLNDGGAVDVSRAEEHAQKEGWRVHLFPLSEKDPLGKARKQALKDAPALAPA